MARAITSSKDTVERLLGQFAPPIGHRIMLGCTCDSPPEVWGLPEDHYSSQRQRERVMQRWNVSQLDTRVGDAYQGMRGSVRNRARIRSEQGISSLYSWLGLFLRLIGAYTRWRLGLQSSSPRTRRCSAVMSVHEPARIDGEAHAGNPRRNSRRYL